MSETRTVHFTIDPALQAFLVYLEAEEAEFSREGYDMFAAGYRARVAEQAAASGGAGEG